MPVNDWRVVGNRLLLRVIDPPAQDSSGLTLPESAVESDAPQTTLAEIVAKGAAVDQLGIGELVIVLKTWARVEIEGEEFIVCDAGDDVLLVKEAR